MPNFESPDLERVEKLWENLSEDKKEIVEEVGFESLTDFENYVAVLRGELEVWMEKVYPNAKDPEMVAKMEALGYFQKALDEVEGN